MNGKAPRNRALEADTLGPQIVDTAIALAEEAGWSNVRLRLVADRLGVPLAEVHAHYRDLDAVADAWFDRALQAMLQPVPAGFAEQPVPERIHLLLMRWLNALAAHREVTVQMLDEKLYPSHPHHWAPMIFNLSRLINWLRDAALLDAPGRRRQVEEIGLTALFLATLAAWRRDRSAAQEETSSFLRRRLAQADRMMSRLGGRRAGSLTEEGSRASD